MSGEYMKSKTEIMWLNTNEVSTCDWNYKHVGTDEEMEKLKNSISRDHSSGVLPVRVVDENGQRRFEVIDGNHRLRAIKELGWEQVQVENFGEISKADAITIARRRNEEWFDTDPAAYATLLRDEVLPIYSMEELQSFMPESIDQMKAMVDSLNFDFDSMGEDTAPSELENFRKWTIRCEESASEEFENALFKLVNEYEEAQIT